MRRPVSLLVLLVGIVGSTTVNESRAGPPGGARPGPTSRPARWSSAPPSSGLMAGIPGLDERLEALGGLIDEMARQAAGNIPATGSTWPSCPRRR